MKRLLLCAIAVVLSCGYGFLDARPSKQEFNQTMHQELHDVIGRIEKVVRAGTSIDASQVIADAILQCLYNSIKIDLAAILPKACTIESSIDGILFTIVDSVDNAVPSLSFTICDKLEPLQPAIGFTVCDEVSFVQEELSFTIVDGLTNLNASLGFTVCDTIANSCQEVKFTVVDKITNMVASLGFTICDAFANALPDTDSVAGIVINKVHAVQESIAFTICQKIELVEGDAASALDKACSILDQLPLDPIDIEPIKFTVCDKAETLCSKIDILAQCFPTPITQADFDSNDGKLTLASGVPSTLQSYCLAEDIIGDSFTEN